MWYRWLNIALQTLFRLIAGLIKFIALLGHPEKLLAGIGKWFTSIFQLVSGLVKKTFELLKVTDGFKSLGIIALMVALVLRIRELWTTSEEFRTRVTQVFDTLKGGLKAVVDAFAPLWECFRNLMTTVSAIWKDSIKPAVDGILDIVINAVLWITENIGHLLNGPAKDIIAAVVDILSVVVDAINIILQAMSPAIQFIVGTVVPLVTNAVNGLINVFGNLVTLAVAYVQSFTDRIRSAFDKVHEIVHNVANVFIWLGQSIRNAIREGINGAINWIETGINNIISRINNSGVLSAINRFTGANIALNYIYIPRLAKGGVVTTPTIAQVGEYPGARSNPEIVTPQSLLKETIDASNGELASVFAQVGQQIIAAINNKDLDVQIGDTTIAKSAARGNRQYQLATGQSLF